MTNGQLIKTSNLYTPLTNINENQEDTRSSRGCMEWSTSTKNIHKNNKQSSRGIKISTIINGRIANNSDKYPSVTKKKTTSGAGAKLNKFEHKVKMIVDSHLKGNAVRINHYLNTKFEVCSLIKPGANAKQLVDSLETDFKCLRRKDVIVINGGTNDIDNNSSKESGVPVKMTQFMQRYNNNNIIAVNIPHRYDLDKDPMTNSGIQAYNSRRIKIGKIYRLECDSNTKYFTRHGLRLK